MSLSMTTRRSRNAPSVIRFSPLREFEDVYGRLGQLMNVTLGDFDTGQATAPWVPLADILSPPLDLSGRRQSRSSGLAGGSPATRGAATVAPGRPVAVRRAHRRI